MVLLVIAGIPTAQLGEEAGQLNYLVQVGHNQTMQLHLENEGNTTIGFQMQQPNIPQEDNQISPTITFQPDYGTINPYGAFAVNVTVFMPLNDTPMGAQWTVILSAVLASNASNPSGAVIQAGVAKVSTIEAVASTTSISTTTTSIPQVHTANLVQLPIVPIAFGVVVIIVAAGAIAMKKKKERAG